MEIVFEDSDGIGVAWERRYLIGQQCVATISSPIEVTDHAWEVDESVAPFEDWIADADEAELLPLTETEDGSLWVRFARPLAGGDPDPAEILSSEVRLLAPTGSKILGSDETDIVRMLTVNKPTASLSAYIGTVQLTNEGVPDDQMELWGGTYDSHVWGSFWVAWAETPILFSEEVSPENGWNYVQTVTPHRRRYTTQWQSWLLNGGVDLLDNEEGTPYPYADVLIDSWGEEYEYVEGDKPRQGFAFGASAYEVLDAFLCYMMYQPPGAASQFVPLRAIEWFWEGDATLSGTWSLSGTAAAWDFSDNFPDHPEWDAWADVDSGWVNE